ncbi:MAG: hypothetical protein AAF415_11770 [Pseudomonadota bacterium]
MPGTVRIWWHRGALRDMNYNSMPVVEEPELSMETVVLNGDIETTGPAPEDASVALVQSDVDLAYVVRPAGVAVLADPSLHKPLSATGNELYSIGIPQGASLSLVELG